MRILGASTVSLEAARAWATHNGAHQRFIDAAWQYWHIAPRYGIPPEIPYAQAAKETAWGKYTGVVSADSHNWCGLKTTKGGSNTDPKAHARFPDDATGVLAHIQHLARYAGAESLPEGDTLVDPRWGIVTAFTQDVEGLGGAWAPSPTYGNEVATRVADLRSFANDGSWGTPMQAQIPGFTWLPADNRHHTKGRTAKIRGGAQHYSAGTDSRTWLTTSAQSNVSATFLVKHNPTLDDRGWQLVWIEDTPHTTAYANPYTVAIEYEHDGSEPIPDTAYEVLAQTWADVAAFLDKHPELGKLELIAGHKVWVANPELTCPDGVEVDRIVRRFNELRAAPEPLPERNPLEVWSATEDPWKDDNPYSRGREPFWIEDRFLSRMQGDFGAYGYVISGAMVEPDSDGTPRLVQYTERKRMEIQPDGSYTEGLVGREVLWTRHPHLAPRTV